MSEKKRLPIGWAKPKVGEIVSLVNGYAFKPSDWNQSGLPIIRIQNLNDHEASFNRTTTEVPEKYQVRNGDLLFAWSGTPGTSFGAHIWLGEDALLNQHIYKVLFDPACLEPKFLREAINYNLDDYIREAHGGAGLAHITKGTFEESELLIAPLAEQRRIVDKLDELLSDLDAGVSALVRARGNLKRYRAAILRAAVTGELTPDWRAAHPNVEPATKLLDRVLAERRRKWEADQEAKFAAAGKTPPKNWQKKYPVPAQPGASLPDLPPGWSWATIEQLASTLPRSIQSGPFGSNLLHSEFQDEGILAIGIDNVLDGTFSMGSENRISLPKFEELKKYQARPLDVVITVMATVGRCCVIPADIEKAIITKHVYRISAEQRLVNPHYMAMCISGAPVVRRQIFGEVRGQTRPGINGEILKGVAIPVPPLTEQTTILERVDQQLSLVTATEQYVGASLKRANRLRQSILKEAFAGRLVPQNPKDEPASVLLERIRQSRPSQNGQSKPRTRNPRQRELFE